MRFTKGLDLTLNVFLPITIGVLIYGVKEQFYSINIVPNYLPDGLWAYALLSSILIIWNRKINKYWIASALVIFIAFEILQYFHIINGTADLWDIFIYFFFSALAVISNKFFLSLKNKL